MAVLSLYYYSNVLSYLESTAAIAPGRTAFSGPKEQLTFQTLQSRASVAGSRLAELLPLRRAAAIMMDKSCDVIVAFMATVYAGGFYSFIDYSQPKERIQAIVQQLDPGIILCSEKSLRLAESLAVNCPVRLFGALEQGEADTALLEEIRRGHIDLDPLYCNFTSGSSGTPKGVLVAHRSVIDFIEVFTETFCITGEDVLGCQAPLDFDVSVKDIYSGLKTGAEVVLILRSYFTFLKDLLELLQERRVTNLTWAVSALCLISTMDGLEFLRPSYLKRMMFSGEVMPANHLRYWKRHYPSALFVNLYGPTEITCNCTYYIIGDDDDLDKPIPIGRPFPNERVFLLDTKDRLVTRPDQEGELCVGGTTLALGYYHDAERTAAVFVQNPLNTAYPETIYRTGDLAKYDEAGLLYFTGRRDFQVKHHGRRVELGEIETALTACGVIRACVLFMEKEERIIAYVIANQTQPELLKALRQKLPDYMIPSEILSIDRLPLKDNGKLDRKALSEAWQKQKAGKTHE